MEKRGIHLQRHLCWFSISRRSLISLFGLLLKSQLRYVITLAPICAKVIFLPIFHQVYYNYYYLIIKLPLQDTVVIISSLSIVSLSLSLFSTPEVIHHSLKHYVFESAVGVCLYARCSLATLSLPVP